MIWKEDKSRVDIGREENHYQIGLSLFAYLLLVT